MEPNFTSLPADRPAQIEVTIERQSFAAIAYACYTENGEFRLVVRTESLSPEASALIAGTDKHPVVKGQVEELQFEAQDFALRKSRVSNPGPKVTEWVLTPLTGELTMAVGKPSPFHSVLLFLHDTPAYGDLKNFTVLNHIVTAQPALQDPRGAADGALCYICNVEVDDPEAEI